MLTEQQEQELQAKIREAVPESMELKEGCRVMFQDYESIIIGKQTTGVHEGLFQLSHARQTVGGHIECECLEGGDTSRCDECDGEGTIYDAAIYIPKEHFTKILGRKLNLQDVLIALQGKMNSDIKSVKNKTVELFHMTPDFEEYKATYDLTKDFHQQSDELKAFLHSLLLPS